MINIIVVDDDLLIRVAFKSLVNWNEYGFNIAGEADNGIDGLELYKQTNADVIVSDIKMPSMDGLQLIEEVKKIRQDVLFIMLSNYTDFSYVKEAFKLGAFDYILKYEMKQQQLVGLFSRIKEVLEQRDNSIKERELEESLIQASKRELRDTFIKDIIWGKGRLSPNVGLEARRLKLRMNDKNIFICDICIVSYDDVRKRYGEDEIQFLISSVSNIIEEILNEYNIGDAISRSPDEYVIVFSFIDTNSKKVTKDRIWEVCSKIQDKLLEFLNIRVSFGVSGMELSGYNNLYNIYKQAKYALRYTFVAGNGKIIFYENIIEKVSAAEGASFTARMKDCIKALKEFVDFPDETKLNAVFGKVIFLKASVNVNDIDNIRLIYGKYQDVLKESENEKFYGKDARTSIDNYCKLVESDGTLDELNKCLMEILSLACASGEENYLVRKAKLFIHDHYSEQISLDDISDFLNISPEHLSRVFSEKTGKNLTKYITEYRIEKAKEILLQSNLKIYEIALKVGYTSTEYFSRSFKIITGKSPKEFVNNI